MRFPSRFVGACGGELIVSLPPLHPDDQPGADADELEALARDWEMRRGVNEPLAVATETREGTALASASYHIGADLVEVWFVSDGAAMLKATYVCPWGDRDHDHGARGAYRLAALHVSAARTSSNRASGASTWTQWPAPSIRCTCTRGSRAVIAARRARSATSKASERSATTT